MFFSIINSIIIKIILMLKSKFQWNSVNKNATIRFVNNFAFSYLKKYNYCFKQVVSL